MKVNPITTNNYNNTNFNGTVDKSVVKLINTATKNEIKNITEYANIAGRELSVSEIANLKKIKHLKDDTLEVLNKYMAKLHPKSNLTIINNRRFLIENSTTNTYLRFTTISVEPDSVINGSIIWIQDAVKKIMGNHFSIDTERLNSSSLEHIKTMGENLEKFIKPEKADKAMFKLFTSNLMEKAKSNRIFGEIRTKRDGEIANKLALEFGAEGDNWVETLLKIREEFKVKKIKGKENIKSNKDKVKKIFN